MSNIWKGWQPTALTIRAYYPGAYFETDGLFIKDNPLGPRNGRHCLPWDRSTTPGYPLGGNKFDLDKWNDEYFIRLKDFVAQAGARKIVVEICFFNCMYPELWPLMPLHRQNNIQGVGVCDCPDVQTLKDEGLVARHKSYVSKITREINEFDNIILEICDEPGLHTIPAAKYTPWINALLEVICDTEKSLPNRHLIAQQVCGTLNGPGDFSRDVRVPVITGQYVWFVDGGAQFGGMQLLDTVYNLDKPIEINETDYYPIWYKEDIVSDSRVEAWEFIVGGGAGFNQLNGLFSTFNPAAHGTEIDTILNALQILKNFMYSFNFLKMRRDPSLIVGQVPAGTFARGMSEPGKQYTLYIHHSKLNQSHSAYIVQPGKYQHSLELNIAAGNYQVEWIEPATGRHLRIDDMAHKGGRCAISTPPYTIDLALRLKVR